MNGNGNQTKRQYATINASVRCECSLNASSRSGGGGGRGGHIPDPGPVKISHKKDGHQRRPHRIHVSRPPLTRPLDPILNAYSNVNLISLRLRVAEGRSTCRTGSLTNTERELNKSRSSSRNCVEPYNSKYRTVKKDEGSRSKLTLTAVPLLGLPGEYVKWSVSLLTLLQLLRSSS